MSVSGKSQPDESPQQTQDAARRGDVLLPALRPTLCQDPGAFGTCPLAEQRVLMLVSRMLPALMASSALGEASPP